MNEVVAGTVIGGAVTIVVAYMKISFQRRETDRKFNRDRLSELKNALSQQKENLEKVCDSSVIEEKHSELSYRRFRRAIQDYLNSYEELARHLVTNIQNDESELKSNKRALGTIFSNPAMQEHLIRPDSYPYLRLLNSKINYQ